MHVGIYTFFNKRAVPENSQSMTRLQRFFKIFFETYISFSYKSAKLTNLSKKSMVI